MKIRIPLRVVVLISCLAASAAWADIVVQQDKKGNITISNNTPSAGKGPAVYRKDAGLAYVPETPALSKVPGKYLVKIRHLAAKYGVKEALIIAVARAESGFNPIAVSKKGAVGIMQLMADTALQYGVVDRYNADQNLEAGVKHLKYLQQKYNGNLKLVLAAYNAGEEAVKKYGGIPPYTETRIYIKRVFQYMGMSYSGLFDTTTTTKIYQYRTPDGRVMITDQRPLKSVGPVTIID